MSPDIHYAYQSVGVREGDADARTRTPRAPSGLVNNSTSDTFPQFKDGQFSINVHDARLRKMSKAVTTSASIHQDTIPSGYCAAMITLTYAADQDWSPYHIARFLKNARQWLNRRCITFQYVWVCELTKAGKPHYHIVFWIPRRIRLPKPDQSGWWRFGSSRIEFARRPVGYLAKYASKGSAGQRLPKGARMYGAGGFTQSGRYYRAWRLSPAYVRRSCSPSDRPQRAPGGGWVLRETGDWFPSFWQVVSRGPGCLTVAPARESWPAEVIAMWFSVFTQPEYQP